MSSSIAIITGGTGTLGTAMGRALASAGHRVFAIGHPVERDRITEWRAALDFDAEAHLCDLADAAATALVVAGQDAWRTVASQMGIEQAMVVDEQGRVLTTVAMAARLIDVTPGIEIIVVD